MIPQKSHHIQVQKIFTQRYEGAEIAPSLPRGMRRCERCENATTPEIAPYTGAEDLYPEV